MRRISAQGMFIAPIYTDSMPIPHSGDMFTRTLQIPAFTKPGLWSINASGQLILTIPGQGPITGTLLFMPFMYAPVDESLIPGTYKDDYGDTWIFGANGTGSTTADGGWTYTWSVEGGLLKIVFSNQM